MSRKKDEFKFLVNLDHSREPRSFRGQENLWIDDIRRIYRLLDRHVEAIRSWTAREIQEHRRPDDYRERRTAELPKLAIAVFGPSGSGKSSLLQTMADDIRIWKMSILGQRRAFDYSASDNDSCGRAVNAADRGETKPSREHPRLGERVHSLKVMNPTTWALSDQFLYAFLAAALEEEREHLETKAHGYPQGLSPVQMAFQDVNEYLRVVDELESTQEYDPLGLSLQKLERHTSGLRLRGALNRFIEQLVHELKSEDAILLLPVDDLDMAPDHLVSSLRDYQSYLMHPQLVPIFTFTDRMPEELIEAYFRQQLSDKKEERRSKRLSISEQLSQQFLARCFPVRNRIRLGPAPGRVQRAIYSSRIETGHYGDTGGRRVDREVLELLTIASFLLFGHPDREDAHRVKALLRPSTLRRQFQAIDAMAEARVGVLTGPQFWHLVLADKRGTMTDQLKEVFEFYEKERSDWTDDLPLLETCRGDWPKPEFHLRRWAKRWHLLKQYKGLAFRLRSLRTHATWASIFGNAVWSLLNVHRDTLRELDLHLEDLYSWSPIEIRSVVLEAILAQDQITRRTVVDRWLNRTDYRRSQVLSLLAANIFRPWMPGEEPHGDEEGPILRQLEIDRGDRHLDRAPDFESVWEQQVRDRLSFPATQGLLWFLNVTIGFYLPQIMARNWGDAISPDEPVRGRMGGNGWDLRHGPVNAVRVAAIRQEIFSFGMLFIETEGFRKALSGGSQNSRSKRRMDLMQEHQLMLRLWSACGYSRGRYWAAFSLWRGLGLIGDVIQLGHNHRQELADLDKAMNAGKWGTDAWKNDCNNLLKALKDPTTDIATSLSKEDLGAARDLYDNLCGLLRSHVLIGMAMGSLLERDSKEEKLLKGFPKWEPHVTSTKKAIGNLATKLFFWLLRYQHGAIYPLPAGEVWIGWRDCFMRRIHGEYILGSLWPRLRSAYLEDQETGKTSSKDFLWTTTIAAEVWSDLILEYWRGNPSILKLLLTCPVFLKNSRIFRDKKGTIQELAENQPLSSPDTGSVWLTRLSLNASDWKDVLGFWDGLGMLFPQDQSDIQALVPHEAPWKVRRVLVDDFAVKPYEFQSVRIEDPDPGSDKKAES